MIYLVLIFSVKAMKIGVAHSRMGVEVVRFKDLYPQSYVGSIYTPMKDLQKVLLVLPDLPVIISSTQ